MESKKLDVLDRVILQSILPRAGGLVEQITQKQLIKKLEFTPEDVEKYELRDTDTGVSFNPEKNQEIEIEFTGPEIEIINKGIDELDQKKEVTQQHVGTILKFRKL